MTSASNGRFAGRAAVVTGASRGIGLGIAQQLVAEGARVCITARSADALDDAVESLGGPKHAIGVPGRSDDLAHQQEAITRTIEAFGSVDVLINNAGINPIYGPLLGTDLDAMRKIFEVNCVAVLSWVQQAHRAWMGEHGGSIVNIASIAGVLPSPGIAVYGSSKAFLGHLTEELAVELAPTIRVNAVAPAVVKTKFAAALYEGREEAVSATYPMHRLGVPEDVALTVAHLASDDASWITGQVWVLDGGVSLTRGSQE